MKNIYGEEIVDICLNDGEYDEEAFWNDFDVDAIVEVAKHALNPKN